MPDRGGTCKLNPRHTSAGMSSIAVGIKIRGGFFDNRIAF